MSHYLEDHVLVFWLWQSSWLPFHNAPCASAVRAVVCGCTVDVTVGAGTQQGHLFARIWIHCGLLLPLLWKPFCRCVLLLLFHKYLHVDAPGLQARACLFLKDSAESFFFPKLIKGIYRPPAIHWSFSCFTFWPAFDTVYWRETCSGCWKGGPVIRSVYLSYRRPEFNP